MNVRHAQEAEKKKECRRKGRREVNINYNNDDEEEDNEVKAAEGLGLRR